MGPMDSTDLEADMEDAFPSGAWTGFLLGGGGRLRQDLHLTFAGGLLVGISVGDDGGSLIEGRYDPEDREARWVAEYPGAGQLSFRGFREDNGIWGVWNGADGRRGGFHIWPSRGPGPVGVEGEVPVGAGG